MKKNYFLKFVVMSIVLIQGIEFSSAQNSSRSHWNLPDNSQSRVSERSWFPNHFQTFTLQIDAMKNNLMEAPMEAPGVLRRSNFIIELPMPDGNFHRYALVESPVMEAALAAAYPGIKTYAGQGIDDPTATIRCDVTQFGFHAYVLSANGTIYIDPLVFGKTDRYMVYYKHDIPSELKRFDCLLNSEEERSELNNDPSRIDLSTASLAIGSELRTYRLALAATGEYTAYYGGTIVGALAGMVTTMNRVNGVFEKELGIHMILVPNDTLLIYANATTDPYTNSSGSTMLGQNQTNINNVIGTANYDMGHVFSTGGGGVASLGCVCSSTNKARGVTGLPSPTGEPFAIDFVAHEMGHQFGASHTFNSETGGCGGGNRSSNSAYEPGSASTIMGYAGLCNSTNNLQNASDAYFHTKSFDAIVAFSQTGSGSVCAVTTSTGNNAPVLTMPPLTYTIPFQTPFKLTASATDPDSDPLTYCWEEYDLGPAGSWNAPSGNAPIFRSFNPVITGTRMFPKLTKILTPTSTSTGEILPAYARSLTFRCTVRDNRSGGGGVVRNPSNVILTVINTTVGFAITAPNVTGISWNAASTQTVTWDVASTDLAPINTANVNIYLSTNNGTTFPIVIATAVPNNGSYSFTVPNNQTASARIMVEADGNVFFDINNLPFTITAPVGINENAITNSINLYPNPANDDFHFVINTKSSGSCRIELSDMTGRMVKEIIVEKRPGISDHLIDISDVAKGMYIVRFELPEGVAEKKLIRE